MSSIVCRGGGGGGGGERATQFQNGLQSRHGGLKRACSVTKARQPTTRAGGKSDRRPLPEGKANPMGHGKKLNNGAHLIVSRDSEFGNDDPE